MSGEEMSESQWGPQGLGPGDTSMAFSQCGAIKTYHEILAFPKRAIFRKRK